MATTEFTLEDIRQVVREESDASFDRKFKPAFDATFKPAFDKAFKPAFISAYEPFADAIQDDFIRIDERFDRLETKVESIARDVSDLKTDMKGLKRIVGQHSKEIIELRARTT